MELISSSPLWFIWAVVFILCVVSSESGRHWRRRDVRIGRCSEDNKDSGLVLPASLGLLSLLISFTFSLALDRYETRRDLLAREAIAIRALVQKSELLPPPDAARIGRLALSYVNSRLAFFDSDANAQQVRAAQARSERLQDEMWALLLDAMKQSGYSLQVRSAMDAIGPIVAVGTERESAAVEHIPARVLYLLVLFAALGATMVGYASAPGLVRLAAPKTIYIVLVATAIVLIVDLDRPRGGGILVSQAPMLTLQEELALKVKVQN